jgi:hypothetical protein
VHNDDFSSTPYRDWTLRRRNVFSLPQRIYVAGVSAILICQPLGVGRALSLSRTMEELLKSSLADLSHTICFEDNKPVIKMRKMEYRLTVNKGILQLYRMYGKAIDKRMEW